MSKKSSVEKNKRRKSLVKRFAAKRTRLLAAAASYGLRMYIQLRHVTDGNTLLCPQPAVIPKTSRVGSSSTKLQAPNRATTGSRRNIARSFADRHGARHRHHHGAQRARLGEARAEAGG